MIAESKKYKIVIGGQTYSVVSDEPEEQLMQAVALLDSMVQEGNRTCSSSVEHSKLVLIAALTLASRLIATNNAQEELLKRIEREVFSTNVA